MLRQMGQRRPTLHDRQEGQHVPRAQRQIEAGALVPGTLLARLAEVGIEPRPLLVALVGAGARPVLTILDGHLLAQRGDRAVRRRSRDVLIEEVELGEVADVPVRLGVIFHGHLYTLIVNVHPGDVLSSSYSVHAYAP